MKQTTALSLRQAQKKKAADDAEDKRRKRLAKVRERQQRLKELGLCLRCAKRKANRGPGATTRFCPICAAKNRLYSNERYRIKIGAPLSQPVKPTGRPRLKPFKKSA